MLLTIDPSDSRPIYVQIMDEIKRARVVGTLRPEEPLPSVRQLAGEIRVNPNTVSQAYRELEREGIVYVRRGQGTFVSASAPTATDRREIAESVAARALLDAHRNGITIEELIDLLQQHPHSNPTRTDARESAD